MEARQGLCAIARALIAALALSNESAGCAACGQPPPEPEAPRNDPLPAQGLSDESVILRACLPATTAQRS